MQNIVKFYLICSLVFSIEVFANEEFSSTQIKKYKNGIFEVVTLKLEDKTTYKEEFPHKLIPFQIRNDKYYSVGTAFLIDDKTFVSAAHVFGIGQFSLLSENFALRDSKGNIFTIKQVEKYSNYRDLIQFSVEQSTASYHEFTIADEYEEGDVIYAAGNALGEGVIFRKGTLTSFTYEPIDGQWKNIRFSAAASPGNSGGPLLNLKGEVVGIVTRKSDNENLNYAFPIKEFTAFSTKEAEFFESQMGEVESTKTLRYTWNFSADLPTDIMALRKLAEGSFYNRLKVGRDEFVAKYGDEIFPKHENVHKYLKNQSNSEMFAIIDINGNGEWSLFEPEEQRTVKISNNQSMWFTQSDKMTGSYQFFMEKPESESLLPFIENKKNILDTFLTSMKWNRNIMDTAVYITSYGEPILEESYTDNYGRVWQMAMWQDSYANRGIMLYCLPMPQGVVCDFVSTSTGWLEVQKDGYKSNLNRMMLSYTAKLSEWESFLDLPKELIPTFLHEAKLALSEEVLTFNLGEFSGSLTNMKLNEDSNLYVAVEIDTQDVNKLVVGHFSFAPNMNEEGSYSVSKLYDLKEDASDSYADFWTKLTEQQSPYNFTVIDEGKIITKQMNLGAHGKSPVEALNGSQETVYLAICELQSKVGNDELDKSCDAFINGLNK